MIIHADILTWAASYDGPLFHALLCDPPYHLQNLMSRSGTRPTDELSESKYNRFVGQGFMNARWDGGDIAFQPETWAALARLLHPGAFLFAFAGSRGYHRMACAIEDAGLIIHPAIGWAFGCLSDDTEILTTNGWEPYHKSIANSTVMCYNPDTDALEWHRVQELVAYDYDETAYRIQSDNTDQLVSRNHRCLVERNGRWAFEYAEHLGATERIPITTEAHIQTAQAVSYREAHRQGYHLSDLWRAGIQAAGVAQENTRRADMRQRLSWCSTVAQRRDTRTLETNQRLGPRRLDRRKPRLISAQHARRAQPGMEGRRYLLQETRQLQGRKVHSLPSRVYQHGPQGWLCNGASDHGRAGDRPAATAIGSGTPQRPRPSTQHTGQFSAVRQQSRSQALRTPRIAIPDLATVTPVHYCGIVWCVRVPTGAFVARRNGKIFITGNSGFPKATRIDTQIDRRAGVERTKVGTKKQTGAKFKLTQELIDNGGFNDPSRADYDITAPATEEAAAWQGHRYGGQVLKPAFEFICVAQKPYAGRPVDSITATGAGALWIDGGRIDAENGYHENHVTQGVNGARTSYEPRRERRTFEPASGRWPANLMLVCPCEAIDWCDCDDEVQS
jgi:hypothetical protein